MTEEELKAIEYTKSILKFPKLYASTEIDGNFLRGIDKEKLDILLNLITKQQEKLKKYKFNMGVICEYSIDVSKGHINAKDAIEGIRKYIYWGQ